MSTFIIQQNVDDYVQQLKTKPMCELRNIMLIQSYIEKHIKLQSEFRQKLETLLNCGNEICFLWRNENSDEILDTIKNIEIIFFYIKVCISNITRNFQIDNKITIMQEFYENSEIKQHLLLIQKQCLDLFQSVKHLQDILTSKAEEVSKKKNNSKLLTTLKNKFVDDPMNAKDLVNLSYILNQLYGDMSTTSQDQIDLIDKYLALTNFIITVNLIYKFDFITENERIEKEERIAIIDKERRRVASLPNPLSAREIEIKSLKDKIEKLEKELNEKEQLYLAKRQELEEQIQEINLELIPLMTHTM